MLKLLPTTFHLSSGLHLILYHAVADADAGAGAGADADAVANAVAYVVAYAVADESRSWRNMTLMGLAKGGTVIVKRKTKDDQDEQSFLKSRV